MTSLSAVPAQRRQRRLNFQSTSDPDDSSEGYRSDSESPSQQQDSQPQSTNPSLRQHFSTALSTQHSGGGETSQCNNEASNRDGVPGPLTTRRQAMATRQAAASSSFPALAAAMGSTVSENSRSAATRAATAAAAVTPLAARHMSSASGKSIFCGCFLSSQFTANMVCLRCRAGYAVRHALVPSLCITAV